jgi:hypothetical protein
MIKKTRKIVQYIIPEYCLIAVVIGLAVDLKRPLLAILNY